MNHYCPKRGPQTGGNLESVGQPEIYKNGRGQKADLEKLRKHDRKVAKENGDLLNAKTKTEYKRAVKRAFFTSLKAERDKKKAEYQAAKFHSLNPAKAARVQSFRDSWTRIKKQND